MIMDFRKINFGLSDAQSEGMDYPNLLIDGYVNIMQVVEQVNSPRCFLFLGYKGSGKSSLSEHLRLSEDETVINQQPLKDFPFKFFEKILDSDDRTIKYKTIWRWLLCAEVLSSLCKDMDYVNSNLQQAIAVLTQLGLFPVLSISSLLKKSTATTVSATIKSLGISHSISTEYGEADMEMLTDYIKSLLITIKEERPHLTIIDELDDILTPNGRQFENIAALINETKDLNHFFHSNSIPAKIIILCRTDMFERLPGQNLNKIRQDNSFTFTWYREGIDSNKKSDLVYLVNKRARLTYPEISDVFDTFFPKSFDDTDIYSAMLNYTRHIPRDFIQLMNYIKNHCDTEKVSHGAIVRGIKDYSTEYFYPEIANELSGYLPSGAIQPVFNVISSLRLQSFSFEQFKEKCKFFPELKNLDPSQILKILYDCSAIGHIHYYNEDGSTRVLYKYRNRSSSFEKTDKILLHRGLWKSMNVSY